MTHEQEMEYQRLTREYRAAQQKLLPAKTLRQHVADNWTTAVAVLVIIVIPMALAVKGAIF